MEGRFITRPFAFAWVLVSTVDKPSFHWAEHRLSASSRFLFRVFPGLHPGRTTTAPPGQKTVTEADSHTPEKMDFFRDRFAAAPRHWSFVSSQVAATPRHWSFIIWSGPPPNFPITFFLGSGVDGTYTVVPFCGGELRHCSATAPVAELHFSTEAVELQGDGITAEPNFPFPNFPITCFPGRGVDG
jgi:hypothetical protein